MTKIIITLFLFSILIFSQNVNAQWVQMNNGIGSDKYIYSNAAFGNNIYAGTNTGIYLSTNNGTSWTQTGLNTQYVLSLAALGSYVFAGTEFNGIYLSTNNGINWTQTTLNNQDVRSIAINGNNIYAGTTAGHGVYKSTDNGSTWTQSGCNSYSIFSLFTFGNYVFAGSASNGVFITTNNGTNWTQSSMNNRYVNSITASGSNVFAATDSFGVYLSTNNGINWTLTSLNNIYVNAVTSIGNNVFAGTGKYPSGEGSIYVSTNNGTNWIEKREGFSAIPIVTGLQISNNKIFCGTYGVSVWGRDLSELIGIKQISSQIPTGYFLHQNYPNPFNPSTLINFQLPKSNYVSLKIYDILGREVETLVNEQLKAGTYQVDWDGSNYASGVYYYKLIADNFSETKRMILLK